MTDEQFIERVRRDLSRTTALWIGMAILSTLGLVAALWLSYGLLHHLLETAQSNTNRGLALGFVAGATLSFIVFLCALQSGLSFAIIRGKGYLVRVMRLLLKYHDQAMTGSADARANDERPSEQ